MAAVPTLKPQLASATWPVSAAGTSISSRVKSSRSEGESARQALAKFAKWIARPVYRPRPVRFDLRRPGQMTVRLPRKPGN